MDLNYLIEVNGRKSISPLGILLNTNAIAVPVFLP
jgi:hypothetical protein